MDLRNTNLYKKMSPYLATAYAEGFMEGEGASETDILTAWQYISDKGIWKHLQGFYGRTVRDLLLVQSIKPPVK